MTEGRGRRLLAAGAARGRRGRRAQGRGRSSHSLEWEGGGHAPHATGSSSSASSMNNIQFILMERSPLESVLEGEKLGTRLGLLGCYLVM